MSTFQLQLNPVETKDRDYHVEALDILAGIITDAKDTVWQAHEELEWAVQAYNDQVQLANAFFFGVAHRLEEDGGEDGHSFSFELSMLEIPEIEQVEMRFDCECDHQDVFKEFDQMVVLETEDA